MTSGHGPDLEFLLEQFAADTGTETCQLKADDQQVGAFLDFVQLHTERAGDLQQAWISTGTAWHKTYWLRLQFAGEADLTDPKQRQHPTVADSLVGTKHRPVPSDNQLWILQGWFTQAGLVHAPGRNRSHRGER